MTETVRIDLSPLVREIEGMGRVLGRAIEEVGSEVGVVRRDIRLTSDELQQLRKEFENYVQQATRTAAVQQSEVRVGNLKSQLDREFGHHSIVRRTSVGLLQAFDIGNVSNTTATSVAEELMIQTPRYWLAPVLVALAAWSHDNEEMAEKSVQEAYSRDKNKTSLFFALVLRRQGRQEAAVRWLRHYLTSLDPAALTREFAIILEATSHDAFGTSGQAVLSEVMDTWREELRSRQEIVESQIQQWAGEIGMHRQILARSAYPTLETLASEWTWIKRQLESASALPEVIDKYEAIREFDSPLPRVLEDLLDDILDRLVTDYDEEELPLRREVVFHEAVVEEAGDLDRARARADLVQEALEETTDVVSLQTSAAIHPETIGVSTQTQRIAIGLGQDDFRTAVGRYCAAYRGEAISTVTYTFGSGHSNYAKTYGFKGCSVRSDTPEETGIDRITQTWMDTLREHIQNISFKNSWYTKPSIIAGAIALLLLLIPAFRVAGVVALIIGAGIVYYRGEQEKKRCAQAVRAVEQVRQQAIDHSISLYRDANAQLVDAMLVYEELDAQESDLLRLIETWPTAKSTIEGAVL
ncbi:MAG: hypothetical protein EOL89_00060 [Actinobacteria bacterium]|nr:hypothetical protein [Actinomycetota bacterium]